MSLTDKRYYLRSRKTSRVIVNFHSTEKGSFHWRSISTAPHLMATAAELRKLERERKKAEREAERAAMDAAAAQRLAEEKAAAEDRDQREARKKQRDEERKQEEEAAKAQRKEGATNDGDNASKTVDAEMEDSARPEGPGEMEVEEEPRDPIYEMHSGGMAGGEDEARVTDDGADQRSPVKKKKEKR